MIERRVSFGLNQAMTPMVRTLLIVNAVVYLAQLFFRYSGGSSLLIAAVALHRTSIWPDLQLWQLITYQFLHGSLWHLLFNLFTLWIFGCDVERMLGSKKFAAYYLLCGIGAGVCHLFFIADPVIGASGAIYGILVAFALFFPERSVTLLLFFILPVTLRAKYLVALFIGISIFSGIESSLFGLNDGVAHLAHLGGALTGFLLLRSLPALSATRFEWRKRREWRQMAAKNRSRTREKAQREEIDRLLDRINEVGYESLTREEKKTLLKHSKKIKD
ncbi:MAG TPA: rhomboid family intramembrane serine protease [bacterium]|nr:rhomboid family intramembrane serine protease [bacterium]HQG45756.1 rhomboid family intramembrane serine protease [bacterium]HQI48409.1 rhomboid family intramembrane serine protease [bacterium]HQJ63231.1 rhomboid family intramembrane serine protease [bacterium]